ncbi:MAG: phosphotransferase [Candidatus Dormibacteria bacterium]
MSSPSDAPDLSAWPGLEVLRKLSSGPRQQVWLGSARGQRFVIHRGSRSAASLDWELRLRSFLNSVGVKSPPVLPTNADRPRHGLVYVEEFISGRAPGSKGEWASVASLVSRLHDRTRGYPQRPGFRSAAELLSSSRGGDIDLDRMPQEVVALVRRAWALLPPGPMAVIHSDLRPQNILIHKQTCFLLDWDEAHVDSPGLDLADLPSPELRPASDLSPAGSELAALAWEVATCWLAEPDYALGCLDELRLRCAEIADP